ncbi:hypothetical protein [Paucisalibacillus globulus]|uniref:hypothetical protein n=1 Tax=Paucisalibacillus globulus TaxID=351095 RepID=UPI0004121041|nr:hypothetical protein [Paucisalibacillus globulus]
MGYYINSSAVEDFENIFIESIKDSILQMVNKSFLLKNQHRELSISFYEHYIVLMKIENNTVLELTRISYEYFIPDMFLSEVSTFPNLPPRLKRYKNMGDCRFRNEIKDSLKDGKIIVQNNKVLWPDYGIILRISPNIALEGIEN